MVRQLLVRSRSTNIVYFTYLPNCLRKCICSAAVGCGMVWKQALLHESNEVTNNTPLGKESNGLRSPETPCLGLQGIRSGSPRAGLRSARAHRRQKHWWCGTHRRGLLFLSTCRQQTMQNFQRNTSWECTFSSLSDSCLFSYTVVVPRKLSGLFLHFLGPLSPQGEVGILLVLWIILRSLLSGLALSTG